MNILEKTFTSRESKPNLVICDRNNELLKRMYQPLKARGYQIRTFNPNLFYSEHFNPLAILYTYISRNDIASMDTALTDIANNIFTTPDDANFSAIEAFRMFTLLFIIRAYREANGISYKSWKPLESHFSAGGSYVQLTLNNVARLCQKIMLASKVSVPIIANINNPLINLVKHYSIKKYHSHLRNVKKHRNIYQSEHIYDILLHLLHETAHMSGLFGRNVINNKLTITSDAPRIMTILLNKLNLFLRPNISNLTSYSDFDFFHFAFSKIITMLVDSKYVNQPIAVRFSTPNGKQLEFFKQRVNNQGYIVIPITFNLKDMICSYINIRVTIHDNKTNTSRSTYLQLSLTDKPYSIYYDKDNIPIDSTNLYINSHPIAYFVNLIPYKNTLNNLFISELYEEISNAPIHPQKKTGFVFNPITSLPSYLLSDISKSENNPHHDIQFMYTSKEPYLSTEVEDKADEVITLRNHNQIVITDKALGNTIYDYIHSVFKKYPLHLLLKNNDSIVDVNAKIPQDFEILKVLCKIAFPKLTFKSKSPIKLVNQHIMIKCKNMNKDLNHERIGQVVATASDVKLQKGDSVMFYTPSAKNIRKIIINSRHINTPFSKDEYIIPNNAVLAIMNR